MTVDFKPIVRGRNSTQLRHTKDNTPFWHVQFKCRFTAPEQYALRSFFVFSNMDKHGNVIYKVKLYHLTSRPSRVDPKKLVAECKASRPRIRVNPETKTIVWQQGRFYNRVDNPTLRELVLSTVSDIHNRRYGL